MTWKCEKCGDYNSETETDFRGNEFTRTECENCGESRLK